ncbi:Dyp-type peroxidase [Kitasatospora sp. NPDC096147]|uniref:Dyp-type peroxidase n=1 Tax=Kitasatospora sp. NPDC096147 TaxID=3364093 RepID=UPI0037F9A59B
MHPSPPGPAPLPRRLLLGGVLATLTGGAAALVATATRADRTTRTTPPGPAGTPRPVGTPRPATTLRPAGPPRASGTPRPPATVRPLGTPQRALTEAQLPYTLVLSYDLPAGLTGSTGAAALRALCADWLRGLPPEVRAVLALGPGPLRRLPLAAPALAELPAFPGDRLDPARGGGDVLVQLCGPDGAEQLTAAAARLDDRAAAGQLTARWRQAGELAPTAPGATPRNAFGFKDGTANPDPADRSRIWLPDGPHAGGCHLVYRRIAMDTAGFGALPAERQEEVIGRRREDGRPLGGTAEHEEPDLHAKHPDGRYVVPAGAHVRQANPRLDGGARMLRLGYGYQDGPDERGLAFCAYLRDPALFVRVQQRLAERDALSAFTEHRASAVGWVPPAGPDGTPLL